MISSLWSALIKVLGRSFSWSIPHTLIESWWILVGIAQRAFISPIWTRLLKLQIWTTGGDKTAPHPWPYSGWAFLRIWRLGGGFTPLKILNNEFKKLNLILKLGKQMNFLKVSQKKFVCPRFLITSACFGKWWPKYG